MSNAILEKIGEFGDAVVSMREAHEKQLAEVTSRVETIEALRDRPRGPGGSNAIAAAYELIGKDGKRYPALTKAQTFYDYVCSRPEHSSDRDSEFSVGEYVRDHLLGRKVSSGAALVPTRIGAQIIDDVRAQLSLIRAGAATIPIEAPTNFARITADATVYEHTEAVADITEGSPTFAAVTANPKTLASLIPLSLEVVQDSPNLDNALRTSIAAATALKLDQLGIAVILADAAIPDSAAPHDPSLWGTATTGTLGAVAAAMALNQPAPTAAIVHPTNFVARNAALASTAGSWLGAPPVLASMLEIPTTSMTLDVSVLGGFQRGVAVAMRQDLTLEMVRLGKPTSGMHYLVAYMRAAAIVIQPKALFIQRKVP